MDGPSYQRAPGAAAANASFDNRPDPQTVQSLLNRYARVRLDVSLDELPAGDRAALPYLVQAARHIDAIYWKQRSQLGWTLKRELARHKDEDMRALERLLTINFGPWDTIDDERPFWGSAPKPPGGEIYPADLTRSEFRSYIEQHPDEAPLLADRTTLIVRDGARLVPVPYHQAYAAELEGIAAALLKASRTVSDPRFGTYLVARAEGLVSGDISRSDAMWIDAHESPIDIAIGPFEVYDDSLLGMKASYEATVMIRHPSTHQVADFKGLAPTLARDLPGAVEDAATAPRVEIGVYDVVYTAGMTNMGSKAIAAMLPNSERVRMEVGSRLLLFNNVSAAKFRCILEPLASRTVSRDQLPLVREDSFISHTLLHETAHALSTCFVRRDGRRTGQTINAALGERYSTIEECRADVLGLCFIARLADRGVFRDDVIQPAAVTFAINSVRSLRFGIGSDHARAAAIVLHHFLDSGAVRVTGEPRLVVDPARVHATTEELARRVQRIASEGDYAAAGDLMDRYATMPDPIAHLLERTAEVPLDIEFEFHVSGSSSA